VWFHDGGVDTAFEQGEMERSRAIGENAAAEARLVTHDPPAFGILTDQPGGTRRRTSSDRAHFAVSFNIATKEMC
jgi:hypothetical protein